MRSRSSGASHCRSASLGKFHFVARYNALVCLDPIATIKLAVDATGYAHLREALPLLENAACVGIFCCELQARAASENGASSNGASSEPEYDYDLFTIGAGSGGTRASRLSASVYGAMMRRRSHEPPCLFTSPGCSTASSLGCRSLDSILSLMQPSCCELLKPA